MLPPSFAWPTALHGHGAAERSPHSPGTDAIRRTVVCLRYGSERINATDAKLETAVLGTTERMQPVADILVDFESLQTHMHSEWFVVRLW